jgi:hypothetical protein
VSERNKAIARSEFELWSTGEVLKKTIAMNRAAFPDMRIDVEDQVAEPALVARSA